MNKEKKPEAWKLFKDVVRNDAYQTKQDFDTAMMDRVNDRINDIRRKVLDTVNNNK